MQAETEVAAFDELVEELGDSLETLDGPLDAMPYRAVGGEKDAHDAPEPWRVDGPGSADWAMRKFAKTQARIEEVKELAQRQVETILRAAQVHIGPIQKWAEEELERLDKDRAFWEMHLTDWHRELREADPKLTSFTLPHGVLRSRKTPDKVEVAETFLPWVRDCGRDDLVRTKVEPDIAAIKQALKDGEIVEGAELVEGEVRYSVEVSS